MQEHGTTHPEYSRLWKVVTGLRGRRRERAAQLFHHLLSKQIAVTDPVAYEKEFNQSIEQVRKWLSSRTAS